MAAALDGAKFLRTSLSKHSVLVVGDGNFSFSVSLVAMCRECGLDTLLVFTSFDGSEKLIQDPVARRNLNELKSSRNVKILHDVDATNLSRHFPDQRFGRIIFNFPHTGGKSNIKKCRELLEKFFLSAAKHVHPNGGDICVTLCKGQGGTPMDQPQRAHGNSWQIVNNAAKAGLTLHQLLPFDESNYPYYQSVGYRSRLTKGFHTSGGLIHIFIPGVRLDPVEDLSDKDANGVLSHIFEQVTNLKIKSQHLVPGHPLLLLKSEIEDILANLAGQLGTSFTVIDGVNIDHAEGAYVQDARCEDFLVTGFSNDGSSIKTTSQQVLSAFKNNATFVMFDSTLTIPEEIKETSHVITNNVIIGRLFDNKEESNSLKTSTELEVVLKSLKKLVSCGSNCKQELVFRRNLHDDLVPESKISIWTNSSDVAHLAKRNRTLKWKKSVEKCTASPQEQVVCNCQNVCEKYLRKDARLHQDLGLSELVLPETSQVLTMSSAVVMESGHVNPKVLETAGIGRRLGWLVKVDLGSLAIVHYQISDIRLLWSTTIKLQRQSTHTVTNKADDVMETPVFVPKPLNLFPPSYTHDISFWVSDDVSQDLFILAVIGLTMNCVKEIKLTEIYHDEGKHLLSFNYRMVYSRCDGPLSHLEAVELQNRLRRALLVLNFGLK